MKSKKKIAVVGAGLFGCTIALILSKKFEVDLYERKPDILNEASMCNQFRFHLGFHYPRSVKTVNEVKKSNKDFINFYGKDIFGKTNNYYGIVKKSSFLDFKSYLKFLDNNKLKYIEDKNNLFTSSKIEGTIKTNEKILDYFKIKKKIRIKLNKSSVNLKLSSQLDKSILRYKNYHKVIIATYKNNNNLLERLGIQVKKKFRYELVEKIAISLPKKYKNISFVVMDGKFVCVDPYLGTQYHLLSHVKHSKLEVINKKFSKFSKKYDKALINVKSQNRKLSNFDKFIKDGSKYLPFLSEAKYKFSYYVVRTLKTNVESTAERTNLTQFVNKNIITVLAGKWNTCVYEAKKIEKLLS